MVPEKLYLCFLLEPRKDSLKLFSTIGTISIQVHRSGINFFYYIQDNIWVRSGLIIINIHGPKFTLTVLPIFDHLNMGVTNNHISSYLKILSPAQRIKNFVIQAKSLTQKKFLITFQIWLFLSSNISSFIQIFLISVMCCYFAFCF